MVWAVVDEVERAVENRLALELRDLRDAVDGLKSRVNLQLVGRDHVAVDDRRVADLGHQTANIGQQIGDLAQRAVGRADQHAAVLRVGDGLLHRGDIVRLNRRGDHAGGIVRTGVDSKTGAQPGHGRVQRLLGFSPTSSEHSEN